MYPIQIIGSCVLLREFCPSDLDRVMNVVGDDRVTDSLSFDSRTRDQASTMIQETLSRAKQEPRTEYYLAVAAADNELVGFARLGLNGVQAAKLGYAIAADYWRRGYASD
ncbi:MAG: GNAT family N-acetyltransferase, partial [Pseudonocardiaceae bacterium]